MNFHLEKQFLFIRDIDFEAQFIRGSTHLLVWPSKGNFEYIQLNCSGPKITKVSLKNETGIDVKAHFLCHEDLLTVYISDEFKSLITPIRIDIDFESSGSKCGLHFVVEESGDYMYCAPYNHITGSVFPCFEWDYACQWFIDIEVPKKEMVALCGDNLENILENHYTFSIKNTTTARNISFAVGYFHILEDTVDPRLTYYSSPAMSDLLKCSVSYIRKMFEFMETNLRFKLPFKSYRAVFVENLQEHFYSSALMTLFDVHLLHNNRIIEQMIPTNTTIAIAIVEQFFGVYVEPKSCNDLWFCWGLSISLSWILICDTMFQHNIEDFKYYLKQVMEAVVKFEEDDGGMILERTVIDDQFLKKMPLRWKQNYKLKAAFVIRSWTMIVSSRGVFRVLTKKVATKTFLESSIILSLPMGRWSTLVENLIRKDGHISLKSRAYFHRRRKVFEIKFAQTCLKSEFLYDGYVKISVQEPEGLFDRVIKVPGSSNGGVEFHPCSRPSRLRVGQKLITRKRDIIEGPSLGWVTMDHDMMLFGKVEMILTVEEARLMFTKETDIWSRYIGLAILEKDSAQEDVDKLLQLVTNKKEPLLLRQEAIRQLVVKMNEHHNSKVVLPNDSLKSSLINLYCSTDNENDIFVKPLTLKFVDDYQILYSLIEAVGMTYVTDNPHNFKNTIDLMVEFLEVFPSVTTVSTSNLRACVIKSMANLIKRETLFFLTEEILKKIWAVLTDALICDMACSSHKFVISSACLFALARLDQLKVVSSTVIVHLRYDFDNNKYLRKGGIKSLLSYVNNDEFDLDAVSHIMRYIRGKHVPPALRTMAVDLVTDRLNIIYSQNGSMSKTLCDVFGELVPSLCQMTTSENDLALVASIYDLISKIEKLSIPKEEKLKSDNALMDLLETKSMASDDEGVFVPRLQTAEDGNICRLSDTDEDEDL